MVFAILLSGILIYCFFIVRASHRRYGTLAVIGFLDKVREKLVRLRVPQPLKGVAHFLLWEKITEKLKGEVKIFNKLNIVMPCRQGVATLYIDMLTRIYENPRWVCDCSEGYGKLFYLVASVNLNRLTEGAFVQRQLLKNCLYVFGTRTVIKKNKLKLSNILSVQHSNFNVHKQPVFKLLQGEALAKFTSPSLPFEIQNNASDAPVPLRSRYTPSYALYCGEKVSVKHFVDSSLPVECFKVSCAENSGNFRFIWKTSEDKMLFDLTHTSDTFYYVDSKNKRAAGLYVRGHGISFGSSFAQSQKELDVFVNSGGSEIQVFVIYGHYKSEVVACISKIKQRKGELDYLADAQKRAEVAEMEELYHRAYFSRFIVGEGLREKYAAALKYVPTLHLPTLVSGVETASDFFAVVDRFELYKKMAAGCDNLNIVLLYSSQNDNVREIINAFINRTEVQELLEKGVFLFFINKVTASEGAIYYLSKMAAKLPKKNNNRVKTNKAIEVTEHISNTYPITNSVFARNTSKQSVSAVIKTRISLNAPLNVVRRVNTILETVSLRSGRTSVYKLPVGCRTFDERGVEIKDNDHITSNVSLRIDARLSAFEERRFDIIRNDGTLSARDRKNAFIGSLSDIRIDAADKRLSALSLLPIDSKIPCPLSLVASVKTAIKSTDQNLLYALLGKRETLPSEIYKLFIERIIGIKLVRGSVQLLPNVEMTGNFTLSFSYEEKTYEFIVKKASSGFSVRYGDQESYNFLKVGV